MKGSIRTKENCPKCNGKFSGNPLSCPTCLTQPNRFYIDLYYQGRIRIYSDKTGHPLDSYHRTARVLETIRYEIDQHIFDPTKYASKDLKEYLFKTRIEAWYQSKLKEVEKNNLAESYTRVIDTYIKYYYLPFFKGMDVRDIKTYHIHQFYEQLPQKSIKYIKNILDALENFFNILVRHEYIPNKLSFPVITLDRKAPRWVDVETQLKILYTIPEIHRPIFTFLAFQGVRPAEARAIKVKDLNFKEGFFVIERTYSNGKIRERVKNKVVRPRLINPVLIPMLKEACKDKHPEAFVFINSCGRPYSEGGLFKIWKKARGAVGLNVTLYEVTRHSFASIAVSNGVPLKTIQEVLGHTDEALAKVFENPIKTFRR